MSIGQRRGARILDVFIDALQWDTATGRIIAWARNRESRCVAVCNVHVVVTASKDDDYRKVINEADMATPDGYPIAWMLRRRGFPEQQRIYGPDLMWALCEQCAAEGLPVYLYGSSEETLSVLSKRLLDAFPALDICGFEAPPFRPASVEEDKATVSRINSSGAGIIFVALGCPKQERWMTEHRGRVKGVMIGVGAAFDFFAGTVRQAPRWMQDHGLEWAFRLSVEPRRLWKRYLFTNSYFVSRVAKDWVAEKRGNH